MAEVYVSIGSNVNREENVAQALRLMEAEFGTLRVSSVYETESVGFAGPNFYNLVVGFETARPLAEVDAILSAIEDRRGRRRDGPRFNDRTLDLDVLLYGDTVNHEPPFDIPRADILEYAFVLCPLAEIAGDRLHPETGRSFKELWAAFSDDSQKLWPVVPAEPAEAQSRAAGG